MASVAVPGLEARAGRQDGRKTLVVPSDRVAPVPSGLVEMVLPSAQVPAGPRPVPAQGPTPAAPETDAVEVGATPGVPADGRTEAQGPEARPDIGGREDAPGPGEGDPARKAAGSPVILVAGPRVPREGSVARGRVDRAAAASYAA